MRCPSEETLSLYADGELQGCELRELDDHILICPICSNEVQQRRSMDRLIRGALATVPVRTEPDLPRQARPKIHALWPAFAAAAAAVLLLMAGASWLEPPRDAVIVQPRQVQVTDDEIVVTAQMPPVPIAGAWADEVLREYAEYQQRPGYRMPMASEDVEAELRQGFRSYLFADIYAQVYGVNEGS